MSEPIKFLTQSEYKDIKDKLGGNLTVVTDPELNSESTNPVQNKVIYNALNDKASTSYVDSAIEAAIGAAIAASY